MQLQRSAKNSHFTARRTNSQQQVRQRLRMDFVCVVKSALHITLLTLAFLFSVFFLFLHLLNVWLFTMGGHLWRACAFLVALRFCYILVCLFSCRCGKKTGVLSIRTLLLAAVSSAVTQCSASAAAIFAIFLLLSALYQCTVLSPCHVQSHLVSRRIV